MGCIEIQCFDYYDYYVAVPHGYINQNEINVFGNSSVKWGNIEQIES